MDPEGQNRAEKQPRSHPLEQTPERVEQEKRDGRTGETLKKLFITVSKKAHGMAKRGLMGRGGVLKRAKHRKNK